MNFEDKEFEKLVKQSRRGRLIKTIFGSTLSLVILIGILLSAYLFYWNLGPFQGEKIAGVPDGQIRSFHNKETEPLAMMLLDNFETYGMNVKAKKITIYVDYYEKDQRKDHQDFGGLINDGPSEMLSQILSWGVIPGFGDTPTQVRIQFSDDSGNSTSGFTFEGYGEEGQEFGKDIVASSSQRILEDGPLELNKRYVLQYWRSNADGIFYNLETDVFDKEFLKQQDQTLIMYMELK
ncbi:hypothetical protein BAU15_01125 [Enterococcus sp. JM4C]|uniref:hypothetical protein n=1 Tax=Candidatus Enterococcus huntleyi TaxID=1857217 RepID=UPI00137AF0F8|nr:hypothetical protein [Enterococcus sp. JM4C]KAF1299278.1 hypothetical protein BAU15_01125 [Enterococcus sp. JM4C]